MSDVTGTGDHHHIVANAAQDHDGNHGGIQHLTPMSHANENVTGELQARRIPYADLHPPRSKISHVAHVHMSGVPSANLEQTLREILNSPKSSPHDRLHIKSWLERNSANDNVGHWDKTVG